MRVKGKLFVAMCVAALSLSSCDNSALKSGYESDNEVQSPSPSASVVTISDLSELTNDSFDQDDLNAGWSDDSSLVHVTFSDSEATVDGSGAAAEGGIVTISKAGTYEISGSSPDGQILINTEDTDAVHLVFNNVAITSTENSPVYIEKAKKTVITLADGTNNVLTDASEYTYDNKNDNYEGAIYSSNSLSFNGGGQLALTANHGSGIYSGEDLKFLSGTYNIVSEKDSIEGLDGVSIKNGSYMLTAGANGISASSDESGKGFVGIESGSFTINAKNNGIVSSDSAYLVNGSFNVISGSGSNLTSKDDAWGKWENDAASANGVHAGGKVEIYGGSLFFDSSDDTIVAGGDLNIYTGSINISSGDDGIVCVGVMNVSGGSVTVSKSYEGIVGEYINMTGGYVSLISDDDGINISGGNDGSSADRVGKNDLNVSSDSAVNIDSCFLNINSGGDGMDIKGDFKITSGSLQIAAADDGKGQIIRCNGKYEIDGGIFEGVSNADDASIPSESSEQNIVILDYADSQPENAVAYVEDAEENQVLSFSGAKEFKHVIISKPELAENLICTWYKATADDLQASGEVSSDALNKGDKLSDFTVEKGINQISES